MRSGEDVDMTGSADRPRRVQRRAIQRVVTVFTGIQVEEKRAHVLVVKLSAALRLVLGDELGKKRGCFVCGGKGSQHKSLLKQQNAVIHGAWWFQKPHLAAVFAYEIAF